MELIIFDFDGTLVDSEAVAVKVFIKHWAGFGVHFTEDEFKANFIGTPKEAEINVTTFARMPPHAWDEGNELFEKALETELEAVKGIETILASLKTKKSVASNSSLNYVKKALKQTKLNHYFEDRVFSAEQVRRPKPHPDLFLHVAETLNADPKKCIIVEDSPTGIRAAQSAGIPVIAFTGAAHFIPKLAATLKALNPTHFCNTAQELHQLLTRLESK